MLVLAVAPVLPTGSPAQLARALLTFGAALVFAVLGGAALLVEARAGRARPGLGTPMDKAFGAWLVLTALARLRAAPTEAPQLWPLQLLLLGLAWLLAIRTLDSPARAWRAALVALAALAVGWVDAGLGVEALLAAALGAAVSLALARVSRPEAGAALRTLARALGKVTLPAAAALAALVVAARSGWLGASWHALGERSQFVAFFVVDGWFALPPLIALAVLLWETRRVAIRGAHLLSADVERRALFHVLVAALVATLALACLRAPLSVPATGVPIVVLLAALSRAGCDARQRVATPRAQFAAAATALVLLAAGLVALAPPR